MRYNERRENLKELGSNTKERKTGNRIATTFFPITKKDATKLRGWDFNWIKPFKSRNCKVVALCTAKNKTEYQGLIAYEERPKDYSVKVLLVESNPHNIGRNGIYEGAGGHLFAIAIKKSYELGFEGHIYFISKTNKMAYYQNTFGARIINAKTRTMVIDADASKKLYETYILGMEEKENDV